ncbi:sensor histidine kinase [Bythopirellula goksoeyrii]|uniref:histidine kinase n=1 Tax=Bythopirellula goksoeyrii TaxID=1400387 RepID=A0A5B9QI96_9BACT|nr:HAMP domain-containing sensor histidine kinase [Bythopirellula goksoeyrii]QEG37285.1 Sensor histidine kinase RcsC [Bythopirellula goksoeyrii]
MSYRGFKRAIGESSLERKCRLLFGTCLLPLIAGSFWWYGNRMNQIVEERTRFTGDALAKAVLVEAHFKKQEEDPVIQRVDERITDMLRSPNVAWQILLPKNEQGLGSPEEQFEYDLLARWEKIGKSLETDADIAALEPQWYQQLVKAKEYGAVVVEQEGTQPDIVNQERWIYQYYEPVFAQKGCIDCHSKPIMDVFWPHLEVGDLMAVVRIETDAAEIKRAQQNNIAWLIVAAITTVFLSMMALYAIVRYIIVKPLRHLRDVSDAVRGGDIEQRAVIHTGDEFEDLGAAFNRMLRQLLRQQDELREVNTELDEKIDEMAEANMRLFEMNQVKSDFLATVSHELRTPLNSIIGFSDLLVSLEKLEEKEKRYAGNIQRSGRQLLDMINDILDLAKIESGKMELRPSEFNIGSVVANQCDMARPLSEKKHIELDCQVEASLPPMQQDCSKVEQIINNLLSNAIKFTPDGGRITVNVKRDRRGELRLSVADTGVGISDSEQTVIFEKFRQGSNVLAGGTAMTREYSGTGLGLSIVRELCRLLGGEITVESELGKGSEFTVVLPWRVDEEPPSISSISEELKELERPRLEKAVNK